MISKNRWKMGVAIVFGLVMCISIAQAEQSYDFTYCGSWTMTLMSDSKELRVFSFDGKGITMSNQKDKVFDNCSFHGVGVRRTMGDKINAYGYWKLMDADGDYVVMEVTTVGTDTTTKFLVGAGKWKGITGSGKIAQGIRAKGITSDSSQSCARATGTFELKK